MIHQVAIFVPGSIGNLGPGLDILGLAFAGRGDTVRARRRDEPGIEVTDPGHPELPTDPERNTAAIAAARVLQLAGADRSFGLSLAVEKGLPLSGGQGGSAASAIAGAVAANVLLGEPLGTLQLLEAGLAAEERVAGRHLDNLAPSLLGGAILVRSLDPIDVVELPVPAGLFVVLAHPEQRFRTSEARSVLPQELPRALALHQAAQVAAMVAALASGDLELLGRSIDDRIAEPARAPLLPGFSAAKQAALAAGALGSSLSGSGPTAFALASSEEAAQRIAAAMRAAYNERQIGCEAWVAAVDRQGARRLP
jgi:homoserine kinase